MIANRLTPALTSILLALAACGEDGDGNRDTLLTGFSGFVILGFVLWLILRNRD